MSIYLKSSHLSSSLRRLGLGALCALSASLSTGCEEVSHTASDNLGGFKISFDEDQLSGQYLTESKVTFNLSRNGEGEGKLSIASSDPTLLQAIDSGNELEGSDFEQTFEVLAEGSVTLTFKDGEDVVLTREVNLVAADELEASRSTMADLLIALNPESQTEEHDSTEENASSHGVGKGEKVIVGGEYSLTLNAYLGAGEDRELIDFEAYAKNPQSELAGVSTSGRNVQISPQAEGEIRVGVQLGGQVTELLVTGVSVNEIDSIEIQQGDNPVDENGEELNGFALAVVKDASGETLYGADVTWTRLDIDRETELEEVLDGELVTFEKSTTDLVPFKVTVGDHSEIVDLPIDPTTQLFASANESLGCDAQGGFAGHLPLSLLLLIIFAVRRQVQQASA